MYSALSSKSHKKKSTSRDICQNSDVVTTCRATTNHALDILPSSTFLKVASYSRKGMGPISYAFNLKMSRVWFELNS